MHINPQRNFTPTHYVCSNTVITSVVWLLTFSSFNLSFFSFLYDIKPAEKEDQSHQMSSFHSIFFSLSLQKNTPLLLAGTVSATKSRITFCFSFTISSPDSTVITSLFSLVAFYPFLHPCTWRKIHYTLYGCCKSTLHLFLIITRPDSCTISVLLF